MASQIILSLIAGTTIAGTAGFLGSLALSKRMALVAGPLGHLALPGIALALIYGFDISLGAFPFVILGTILIWLFEMRTKLPMEALTAIVFASGVAVALLFLPISKAEAALTGNISNIGFLATLVSLIICLGLFLVIRKIYSKMVLMNISEDLAKVEGINVKKYNLIYLLSIAGIVALGVRLVGGLLTAALVAIPAAAARNWSQNLKSYISLSITLGITSAILGILLSEFNHLPPGPLIIIVSTLIFIASAIFKPR
ncbi:metal ABC transporter permease [bacterium]|nr:metal ABC transporter permease [bacterium]